MSTTEGVDALIARYLDAKRAEDEAAELRVAIGAELAACFDVPTEGQSTHVTERYKVRLKGVINRRVDWSRMDLVYAQYVDEPRPEKTKRELDTVGLRWIAENQPAYYVALCDAITSTPGRTGIEVTPKESK